QSELKGLAGELYTLRRYHRQVLHDLPMGVCSVGGDRVILNWNIAMRLISGIDGGEVIGKTIDSLPEPWSGLLGGFLRTQDRHLHKVQTHIEGRHRWFNLHKAAIDTPDGDTRASGGTVILLEDLTELQNLEAELTHSERLASIGRLAAGVAHEIGNPVTNIACLAQDLRQVQDMEEIGQGFSQILDQTRRISDIVQSLVKFSHSGTPEEHEPRPIPLHDCISEATRFIQLGREGKQVTFHNNVDAGLQVLGDKQRLLQVFVNLFSNACDASDSGDTVSVETELDEHRVRLYICDQGSGIAEEYQDRVFEPFFTTKQAGEGTGLGLAMVYNIVTEHGGSIGLNSTPGQGTCFILTLPRAQPETLAAEVQ
ncbi:MAG: PAS domain-containing protein, partial [Gammaproteobacteria bacterium]|nr:PAS domain-containing protein [Gammaproteobacteria bacterium]